MEILSKLLKVVRHRPDWYPRGSPKPSGPGPQKRRRKKLASVLLTMLCVMLGFTTVAQAATSKTGSGTVTSNGVYTVIAIDEAGNRTIREITIDNIIPKEIKDDDGNVLPDKDATDTDEDYTEDIIATLIDDTIITSNGKYTVMAIDQAGNITYQNVEVTNISKNTNSPGKDDQGDLVPDTPGDDEDYTEDIRDTLTRHQTVTTNGQFTAFVTDEAGNMTKRTYTVTNIKEEQPPVPGETPEIKPDNVPDTDEDYTESIIENRKDTRNVTSNGVYSTIVTDEAGNVSIVKITVTNIAEPDEPEPGPEPDPGETEIKPDPDAGDTDEDYTEDIITDRSSTVTVTESGLYAAIVKDKAGNIGSVYEVVTITDKDPDNPKPPSEDVIKPDTPGGEEPSPDGNEISDTTTVYENGYYSASGLDNVGNVGLETILVKNIGAPDIKILKNPASLVRKTADDGTTYGEATFTFTVTIPDGALITSVAVKDADGNEMPLGLSGGIYTATVQSNGIYTVYVEDAAGRDGEYPVTVDYIYELMNDETVEVMDGETVTLDAKPEGGTPDSYQWYTCEADGSNAKPIEGATEAVYEFTASPDFDDTYYFCIAKKDNYSVTSKLTHLRVYFAPIMESRGYYITAESFDFTLSIGKDPTDTIRIVKDGNPAECTYQWYYAVNSRAKKIPIAGATNSTYTATATADMNGYYFFCEVKTEKFTAMLEKGIYLYVCGKPSAPVIEGRLDDNTLIPSDTWSTQAPLNVTIGGSRAAGTVGSIEYRYSYDLIHWFGYEDALVFDQSTEGTHLYAKAVNTGMVLVESDITEHIIKIELEDPSIHPDEDDVVPGVRYAKDVWVNEPTPVSLFVNTYSGVGEIRVYFKGEDDTDYSVLRDAEGNDRYKLSEDTVDGENFTCTRIKEGLWRVDFGAAENGWYHLEFSDNAGRPLDSPIAVQPFEITHIDYGVPTVEDAVLDNPGDAHANEKNIKVTGVMDAYTDSKYGFSEMKGYTYAKEVDGKAPEIPAKGDDAWILFENNQTSSFTKDDTLINAATGEGRRTYEFNIHLAGHDDNGTYHIWTIDDAGNVSEAKVVVVEGLMDKMQNVAFDKKSLDLTVPTLGIVNATFDGEPESIVTTSSNPKVATVDWAMVDDSTRAVSVTPVNFGTTTVSITLKDYDGTEYNHTVSVTVKNLKPREKVELSDIIVKPDSEGTFTTTIEGTNLHYQWYYADSANGSGTAITEGDKNYKVVVTDISAAEHKVDLVINKATTDMTNTYYWCVAYADEGTPEFTMKTRVAKLTVVGSLSKPTISASSGGKAVTSGQWTNSEITFTVTGSTIAAGSGSVGYQYRYDETSAWLETTGSILYVGDVAEKTLYVRAYNTLDEEVVSEEEAFIIRQDTVAPTVTFSGMPTSWTSVDQNITIKVTDALSGVTDDTVNITVTPTRTDLATKGFLPGAAQPGSGQDGTYTVIFKASDSYLVTVHDQAGNETTEQLIIDKIDKEAPTVAIIQSGSDGTLCNVTASAKDDASKPSELLFSFDGGSTWTIGASSEGSDVAMVQTMLKVGQTYAIRVKDAAGNITTKNEKITGTNSGGNGGGRYEPELISSSILSIEGYKLGKVSYIQSDGTKHEYVTKNVNGTEITCLPVEVEAYPDGSGYLYGYAQLGTGQRFPIYWDDAATKTVSNEGGTGYFYIDAAQLNTSKSSTRISVVVAQYSDAELKHRTYSDSLTAPITIDVTPPVAAISYNRVNDQITVVVSDPIAGVASVRYAIEKTDGTVSDFTDYTGPFAKPANCQRIIVEAADKLDNTSRTTSANLITGEAGNGGIDITQEAYANSYYYRTSIFNYYLIGGTNKNR